MLIVDVTLYGNESFYFLFFMSQMEVEIATVLRVWSGQTKRKG